jgi:hypothetical protein
VKQSFGFDPVFPVLQVAGFGLLAVAVAAWLYRRGEGAALSPGARRAALALACARAAVVAGVAALLLNPILTRAQQEPGKAPLLVLLDTSHSMAVPDVGGTSRFAAAKRTLLENSEILREYQQHFTPIYFGVAEGATRQELNAFRRTAQPNGARSQLGEGIAAAISAAGGATSGGVLLVSDGRSNGDLSPVEVAKQAKARRFPVFTVCLGSSANGRDVALVNRRPQVYAEPGQEVTLSAEIKSAGYSGQTAQVDLLKEGRPVQTRSVALNDGRLAPVSFPVQEASQGSYRYGIAVRPMPGEGTDSNNRGSVLLQVLKSRARVLVLEGRPTWDAKFLIQALHTDPSIEVDAIFKLTSDKFFAVKGAPDAESEPVNQVKVPSTPAELGRYDVVIIGRGFEEFFTDTSADALKRYVAEHAGNLIFLRGRAEERAANLQALEPVRWSDEQIRDFRLQLTEEGKRNPAFNFRAGSDPEAVIQKLPSLISATRVEGEKALAVVLARTSGLPASGQNREMAVLAYQNYGQGKVVGLVGQGLWRWAFLPPDLKDYAGCYNDFWTQLIRWLVSQSDFLPGQDVSLKTDRTSYSPGDTVNLLVFTRGRGAGQAPAVRIVAPDGRESPLQLGKAGGNQADYTGAFKPRQPGEYLATLSLAGSRSGGLTVPFSVFHTGEEDVITAADPQLMAQVARAGGGEALTLDDLRQLPQKLRDAQSLLVLKTEPHSAWDRWWVLAGLLALLTAEWTARRRMGLV